MNNSQLLLDTYFGDNDSILVLGDYCEENNIYFQGLINADVEDSLLSNRYDHNGNDYDDGYKYGDGDGYGNGYGNGHGSNDGNDGYYGSIGIKEFYL